MLCLPDCHEAAGNATDNERLSDGFHANHVVKPLPSTRSSAILAAAPVALVLGAIAAPGADLVAVVDAAAGQDRFLGQGAGPRIGSYAEQQGGDQDYQLLLVHCLFPHGGRSGMRIDRVGQQGAEA